MDINFRLIKNTTIYEFNYQYPLFKKGAMKMIFINVKRQIDKETDKQKLAKIIAQVLPIVIRCNKLIFSINKDVETEIKLVFK